eukprot:TRINITY_DN4948_c1_g1_i1.p1 TRINITY_DN4948_c1_g1~~TRINITY_DN4948_c1_g1_i1.p1  ORF type:complete len:215 (-),score=22.26 TRINITY_DN4948_c1_g1_i1:36-680(-)
MALALVRHAARGWLRGALVPRARVCPAHTDRVMLPYTVPLVARGAVAPSHLGARCHATAAPAPSSPAGDSPEGRNAPEREAAATSIRYLNKSNKLEVGFNDGHVFTFPSELLRVYSPSAENRRHAPASHLFVEHPPPEKMSKVRIMAIEAVGNYAVRLTFTDLHDTGIFSWAFLHDLGSRKGHYMRRYMRALRSHGKSRHPNKPLLRARAKPDP